MLPTEKEIKTALNILDRLFDMGMDHTTSGAAYAWCRRNDAELSNMGIHYGCGATKIVFICDELENWVIKVGENFYTDESSVGVSDDYRNYCEEEAVNYKCACNNGLSRFFAATYKIHEYDADTSTNLVVCLQEKVDPDSDKFETIIDEYMDENGWSSDDQTDEDRLDAVFGSFESQETLRRLMDFVEEYEINDLHSENYGIRADGTFAIIDFCGYDDDYSY